MTRLERLGKADEEQDARRRREEGNQPFLERHAVASSMTSHPITASGSAASGT